MGNVSGLVLNVVMPSIKQTHVSTIKFHLSAFFLITRQTFLQTRLRLLQFRLCSEDLKSCFINCFKSKLFARSFKRVTVCACSKIIIFWSRPFEASYVIHFESYFNCLNDLKKPFCN